MSAASRAPQRTVRTRGRNRNALITASAAAAALLLSACGSGGVQGGSNKTGFIAGPDGIATAKKGERAAAPDLSGKTLEGKDIALADYKGKVVVINVWGSWCPPCRAEAPNFAKVSEETAKDGVQFVGINTRDTSTGPAKAFEEDYGVTYPSLYDPTGKLMLRFEKGTLNPQAIPSTLIIDREGKIAARSLQPLSEEKLRKMLDPVVAEK
ncbi:TlpA family protein disulfide reductase [Streptomyces cavernae]|uniref:TlpA family protein disulfide reductase n=1 Tax=Streptomyces cavernae TaxID=2259034 RepID=UPI000FEB9A65|nr:TlpA disulfide reductase family protein [Streptomyces cavernae]